MKKLLFLPLLLIGCTDISDEMKDFSTLCETSDEIVVSVYDNTWTSGAEVVCAWYPDSDDSDVKILDVSY